MDAKQLASIPLFAGLSKQQLGHLATLTDEVDLPAGKKILDEGTFAYEFVVIESGTATVTIDGKHVNDLGPGDFFGEIALLEKPRRTASVETTSPMRAIVMTGGEFRAMLRELPLVAERVRGVLDERLSRTGRRQRS